MIHVLLRTSQNSSNKIEYLQTKFEGKETSTSMSNGYKNSCWSVDMAGIKLSLVYAFLLNILWVYGKIIPSPYNYLLHYTRKAHQTHRKPSDKSIEMESDVSPQTSKYDADYLHGEIFGPDERCAILVVSNQGQSNAQQSIIRKYRYNKDGDLIPSSVKYFIKFPQGDEGTEMLVPLKDRAFTSSGGFLRYYKEVPPIPQSWRR